MSRRIEIQLTSRKSDETWTWRAAGAREPKGVVASSLVPEGVKEGDVLRAEVDPTIDGIELLSMTATTAVAQKPAEVVETVASAATAGTVATVEAEVAPVEAVPVARVDPAADAVADPATVAPR